MNIYDIAKLSGVSKSTVSRVLNGDDKVSTKSKEKVEAIIREHNYVPNRSAAMTKKNRKVILVLVTRLDSFSETRLIRGMMQDADENTEFLIAETQFSIAKTKKIIASNKSVNAIVIFAISGIDYRFLDDALMPIVIVGQNIETKQNNLYYADYESMKCQLQNQEIKSALFLGYDQSDATMVRRYNAAKDVIQHLDVINACEYGHVDEITNYNLLDYDTFICATETIALQIYKQLLIVNHQNYQIYSAGNNKSINFVIDNFATINFHYKQSGQYIIKQLNAGNKFKIEMDYTLM